MAGQLSDIFDQYLVYRATWINAWKAGKLLDLGAEEIWQAELWRFLDDDRQSAPHRVAQWRQLLSSINAHHLPERYFVFGIATLAPIQAEHKRIMADKAYIADVLKDGAERARDIAFKTLRKVYMT